jgi:hypothetical protein
MFDKIIIRETTKTSFLEFLQDNDFFIEQVTDTVIRVNRTDELPVFLTATETALFFQVDLGNVSEIASLALYSQLLDLNTEILPVSIGLNTTNETDHRLVLVESREIDNLDSNEIMAVFDALEIGVDKVELLLSQYLK